MSWEGLQFACFRESLPSHSCQEVLRYVSCRQGLPFVYPGRASFRHLVRKFSQMFSFRRALTRQACLMCPAGRAYFMYLTGRPSYMSYHRDLPSKLNYEGLRHNSCRKALLDVFFWDGLHFIACWKTLPYALCQNGPQHVSCREGLLFASCREGLPYMSF